MKDRAFASHRLGPDATAVRLHDALAQRQTDAIAGDGIVRVGAGEHLEYV